MLWQRTIVSIAIAFIFLAHAPSATAVDITAADGSVTISGNFSVIDYSLGRDSTCFLPAEGRHPWHVHQSDSCTGRNGNVDSSRMSKGKSFFHFQIVSGDGLCLLLDARLDGSELVIGGNTFNFTLPIDEMLTSSSFSFAANSDYESVASFASQNDDFDLLPGEDYLFVFLDNHEMCLPPPGGGGGNELEDTRNSIAFTIPCCIGPTGNVDFDPDNVVDVADLTFLIDHLFINFPPLPCFDEADVNQDGNVDIADQTALIDHLFITFAPLADCP